MEIRGRRARRPELLPRPFLVALCTVTTKPGHNMALLFQLRTILDVVLLRATILAPADGQVTLPFPRLRTMGGIVIVTSAVGASHLRPSDLVPVVGYEPTACAFGRHRSVSELYGPIFAPGIALRRFPACAGYPSCEVRIALTPFVR